MANNTSLVGYLYIFIGVLLILMSIGQYILFFVAYGGLYVFALGLQKLGRPGLMMKITRVINLIQGRR